MTQTEWPHKAAAAAGVAAATVLAFGFSALALVNQYAGLTGPEPGFWSYASGTLGDAIFLTVMAGGLTYACFLMKEHRSGHERIWFTASFVLCALLGAAVPATWLIDAHAQLNWSMPAPHHFNLAGWWHAAFLALTTGFLGATTICLLRRLRRARLAGTSPAQGVSTALALATFAGLGMVFLISLDSVNAGRSGASVASLIALALALAAFLAAARWALGPSVLPVAIRAAPVAVAFLVGTWCLTKVWPPDAPVVMGLSAVAVTLVAIAATSDRGESFRWPVVFAVVTLQTGALAASIESLANGDRHPLLWVVLATLASAVMFAGADIQYRVSRRDVGFALFLGYCTLVAYLAGRIVVLDPDTGSVGASVAIADTAFDVMVFAVIQSRFSDMTQKDAADITAEYVSNPSEMVTPVVVVADSDETVGKHVLDVSLLGIAVAIGLLTLLASAAEPLGMNRATVPSAHSRWAMFAVLVGILLVWMVNERRMKRWREQHGEPLPARARQHLDLPERFWILPILASGAWAFVCIGLTTGEFHLPLLAAVVGSITFLVCASTMYHDLIPLQTLRPRTGELVVIVASAFAIAYASAWFVGIGMWNGTHSLSGTDLAAAAAMVFCGNAIVILVVGQTLAWGLPSGRSTEHFLCRENVRGYVALDAVVIGVVFVIAIVIPLYAASRDVALKGSALVVVASLVFLPGLINGIVWGLRNSTQYMDLLTRARDQGIPRTMVDRTGGDWALAVEMEDARLRVLDRHLTIQRWSSGVLMACGLAYLASVLLN